MSLEYYQEIEAHFAAKRGTPFVVSPTDWELMKTWAAEGIPLSVVIEAIDSVFEKNAGKKTINGLKYCRHAVKDLWKERKELQVGAHDASPEADVEPLLDALSADLASSTAPPAVLDDFAQRIRELARERSVPKVEEKLIELEEQMIDAIFAASSADDVAAIRTEITRALGGTKLDEKTRARTEEANRRRIVRERFALPRLTLFR